MIHKINFEQENVILNFVLYIFLNKIYLSETLFSIIFLNNTYSSKDFVNRTFKIEILF